MFGAALIVLPSIGRELMIRNGSFSTGSLSELEIFVSFSPLLGLLAILMGIIGMLFHDVQKEHTDSLLARLEHLSNPGTLKRDDAPRINQVRP